MICLSVCFVLYIVLLRDNVSRRSRLQIAFPDFRVITRAGEREGQSAQTCVICRNPGTAERHSLSFFFGFFWGPNGIFPIDGAAYGRWDQKTVTFLSGDMPSGRSLQSPHQQTSPSSTAYLLGHGPAETGKPSPGELVQSSPTRPPPSRRRPRWTSAV